MEGNKKTKGRQKIEIKRIENEEERLVTFSKRRAGIFKKASELTTLTGAEIAIVIFSPTGGKPYSYGHPSTDAVTKRFLGQQEARDIADIVVEAKRLSDINVLTQQLDRLLVKVDEKKEKGRKLKEWIEQEGGEEVEGWWRTPIEQLGKDELIEARNKYQELLLQAAAHFKQKSSAAGASSSSGAAAPLEGIDQVPLFPPPPGYD